VRARCAHCTQSLTLRIMTWLPVSSSSLTCYGLSWVSDIVGVVFMLIIPDAVLWGLTWDVCLPRYNFLGVVAYATLHARDRESVRLAIWLLVYCSPSPSLTIIRFLNLVRSKLRTSLVLARPSTGATGQSNLVTLSSIQSSPPPHTPPSYM
jgi:hypothetical protein